MYKLYSLPLSQSIQSFAMLSSWFSSSSWLQLLAIDMAVQLGGWSVAAMTKTEKFYDLTGSAI